MKFVSVNGRTPVQSLLRIVLRANRRKLLESLPPSSPTAITHATSVTATRGLNTQGTREGIMTTIQDTNRPGEPQCGRARSVIIGAAIRMVRTVGGAAFCRRRCKDAYLREIMLDRDTVHRLCGLLGVTSRSRQAGSSST